MHGKFTHIKPAGGAVNNDPHTFALDVSAACALGTGSKQDRARQIPPSDEARQAGPALQQASKHAQDFADIPADVRNSNDVRQPCTESLEAAYVRQQCGSATLGKQMQELAALTQPGRSSALASAAAAEATTRQNSAMMRPLPASVDACTTQNSFGSKTVQIDQGPSDTATAPMEQLNGYRQSANEPSTEQAGSRVVPAKACIAADGKQLSQQISNEACNVPERKKRKAESLDPDSMAPGPTDILTEPEINLAANAHSHGKIQCSMQTTERAKVTAEIECPCAYSESPGVARMAGISPPKSQAAAAAAAASYHHIASLSPSNAVTAVAEEQKDAAASFSGDPSEWLAAQISALSQKVTGALLPADIERGGLIGRSVGFVLLDDLDVGKDIISAGLHTGR